MFPDLTKIENAPTRTSIIESIDESQADGRISYGSATAIAIGAIGLVLLTLSMAIFWRAVDKRGKLSLGYTEKTAAERSDESEGLIEQNDRLKRDIMVHEPKPNGGSGEPTFATTRSWTT